MCHMRRRTLVCACHRTYAYTEGHSRRRGRAREEEEKTEVGDFTHSCKNKCRLVNIMGIHACRGRRPRPPVMDRSY